MPDIRYPRNTDLDPQLVWRGKDEQDGSDLLVHAAALHIQERVHPQSLIADLRRSCNDAHRGGEGGAALFGDSGAVARETDGVEYHQHPDGWSNRMILGDSLQVMASLAERSGLRGKVQCVYIDPPYGIKFNSNFQWSTTSRDVKDGSTAHITREPEQVKAFRDTWRDGIHSYLTYLRDRLTVARDLLHETGSVFVQIGDENVHRVRALMDEVFGEDNAVAMIAFTKGATGLAGSDTLAARLDYILWYGRSAASPPKFRQLYTLKSAQDDSNFPWITLPGGQRMRVSEWGRRAEPRPLGSRLAQDVSLTKPGPGAKYEIEYQGRTFDSGKRWWGTTKAQLERALKTDRIIVVGNSLRHLRYLDESSLTAIGNLWDGFLGQSAPVYVVQTNTEIVQRCLLMTTDPGDLVLDPTCGSGTTAYVAEQWGRRWITIDTSRVALALARARIMGARYPSYVLSDPRGVQHGFACERVPRITLKSIANNMEIDVIWDNWQQRLEPLRRELNSALQECWQDWEIPREPRPGWSATAIQLHAHWWQARLARQKDMDASITAKAESVCLYDRPLDNKTSVRVAGTFTVESLSPHRMLAIDENDRGIDPLGVNERAFEQMILDNLAAAGLQQAHKGDKITFSSLAPWPGKLICAKGGYGEGDSLKRAGIFVGPEFGGITQPDLVAAAREAADAGFDVLIACAFNFEAALASELDTSASIPVLQARMNADLHMDLKSTGKGNLFVIFGEPDIDILHEKDGRLRVKVNGVDVFDPSTGTVRSDSAEAIACWFIDTDYSEESFFVRHAYFLGQNDPYDALRASLKAQIHRDVWESMRSDTSRPFERPKSGRIAVKVINHLGDEVMKVFRT
jgi:adenine-specific DNA-methyltransferase